MNSDCTCSGYCAPRRREGREGARRFFGQVPLFADPRVLRAFAVRFCFCFFAAGCPKPQIIAGPPVDAVALYAQVEAAHRSPETLSCKAYAIVDAPDNGGRSPLLLSVKRPASLRIEVLTPLGDPVAVLVADQGRFALLDLRNNLFHRGPATPRNLSRVMATPLTADELVSLLTGAIPPLPEGVPLSARRDGDGYLLALAAPGAVQWVALGADLRVLSVRRTSEGGAPIWEVSLDEHDDALLPRVLHLEAATAKTKVDLRLRSVVKGSPPPPGAFILAAPPGMRVEDVE